MLAAVSAPTWKWEWNLNTVVIIFGFIAGIAAWGATWERVTSGQGQNRDNIERIDRRLTALEAASRTLDNHELRLTSVEAQVRDAATAMRTVESTLNILTTDVRVVKEILQRLEASQNGTRPRNPP